MSDAPHFPAQPDRSRVVQGAYRALASRAGDEPIRLARPPSRRPPRPHETPADHARAADALGRAPVHDRVEETFAALPFSCATTAAFVAIAEALALLELRSPVTVGRVVVLVLAVATVLACTVFEVVRRGRRASLVFTRTHVGLVRHGAVELVLRPGRGWSPGPARWWTALARAASWSLALVGALALAHRGAGEPRAVVEMLSHIVGAGVILGSAVAAVSVAWLRGFAACVVLDAADGPARGRTLTVPRWRLEIASAPR